jgi:streptogramin lyase
MGVCLSLRRHRRSKAHAGRSSGLGAARTATDGLITAVLSAAVVLGTAAGCAGSDAETHRRAGLPCSEVQPATVVHASVVRIDADSGCVKAVIGVGADPLLLAIAAGRVWTLDFGEGTLSRIDPGTNAAAHVDLGEAAGMASDGSDIWVAANGNALVRLDGVTGEREHVLRLAEKKLFELRDAGFLTVAAGSIWLTIPVLGQPGADPTLWRVDPQTGVNEARAPLRANPVSLAADDRYVWVANIDANTVTRVDVLTDQAKQVETSVGPAAVATCAGSLWLTHYVPEVWRIDPTTARAQEKIHLETPTTRGIACGGEQVWVSTESGLLELDPSSNRAVRTINLIEAEHETGPTSIAYLNGDLWVSVE